MARTKTTFNPPPNVPPNIDYKALYPWASDELLDKTSTLTSSGDVIKHREDEVVSMSRMFGRECDAYVSIRPCAKGEPVCIDDRANDGEPFFFLYATVFKRIKLRLLLSGFERALLKEISVASAQLHPNSWAFAILCNHFGHPPSVDVFLHFFEAKSPGKKLWVRFNGVAGRVLLTLFQQSYKGFKGKFFKVCCTDHDPTLLDGFPLYWVGKLKFRKPKSLEELTPPDRELCQVLASLGAVFNTAQLIKHEYRPSDLKGYIGTCFYSSPTSLYISVVNLHITRFVFSCLCIYWFTSYILWLLCFLIDGCILCRTIFSCFIALAQVWCLTRRKGTGWLM